MEPNVVPKKHVGMIILKVVAFVVSILVGLVIIGGFGLSCAFGSNDFACHRVLPLCIGIGVALVVILIISFFVYRKILQKAYWIIFLVWLLLLGALMTVPKDVQHTYLWGITKRACEVGRPAVPWGWIPHDKDNCYSMIGECFSLNRYTPYCFMGRDVKQITNISQCDIFPDGKDMCQRDFAIKTNNIDYCKNIPTDESKVGDREWERFSCVNGIVFKDRYLDGELSEAFNKKYVPGTGPSESVKIRAATSFKYCDSMSGVERDVCLYQASIDVIPTYSLCNEIGLEWLKNSCVAYQHDKENENQ